MNIMHNKNGEVDSSRKKNDDYNRFEEIISIIDLKT
jgi:hypothetical protein